MLELPFEHVGQNLRVAVRVLPEALAGLDDVVVDHAQRVESHVVGIPVVAEREAVPAVEPVEPGPAAVVGASFPDLHRVLLFPPR